MSLFTNDRLVYIILRGHVFSLFYCYLIYFSNTVPYRGHVFSLFYCYLIYFSNTMDYKKTWVNSMGCKNGTHGFSPLYYYSLSLFFSHQIPWVYTMVYQTTGSLGSYIPNGNRNNYRGDYMEEVDGH
jgi:hypothetical protein